MEKKRKEERGDGNRNSYLWGEQAEISEPMPMNESDGSQKHGGNPHQYAQPLNKEINRREETNFPGRRMQIGYADALPGLMP